ncbi:MAG: tryptophan--tRNA ligase [Nocardioidaceae bacterium]
MSTTTPPDLAPVEAGNPHPAASTRVLSGITPSGPLTLGNYLGALRRFVDGQAAAKTGAGQEGFFFVADLHAMTMPHEPSRLHDLTVQTAALYFASGLDPQHSTVFLQSHVRAHVELSYLLESTAHPGELTRMIQFKEKGGRPGTRASLFTYPCLMAADILLYDTESVPVGGDQSQHVELARDLAIRFNRLYGDTFVVPRFTPGARAARVADLADPTSKMSKSAPDQAPGVIRMLDDPKVVTRKINRAVTDSDNDVRYDPAAKPGVSNLLDIIACLEGVEPTRLADSFSTYGALKKACAEAVVGALAPLQRRYTELVADPGELTGLLAADAERARDQAEPVVARAKQAMGLVV